MGNPAKYMLASPDEAVTGYPVSSGTHKQGHKCCGGCCDVRRAVVIVNIISAVFAVLGLAGVGLISGGASQIANLADDDATKQAFSDVKSSLPAMLAILAIELICYGVAIFGAISFNHWMVLTGAVCYGLQTVYALATLNLPGAIMMGCFCYPHVFLISEMKSGIMTPENYPNEKQSCCCV